MTDYQNEQYSQLAQIAVTLESHFPRSLESWNNSPFKWIKSRPSRTIGAIVETLVEEWLIANGLNVQRPSDSQADRIVEGFRVEIKGSTLWKSGNYKFQQIRDQNYDFIVCLGISPFEAHCWVIPKEAIPALRKDGVIRGQHTGNQATDTEWISINPQKPHNILKPQNGNLTEALQIVRRTVLQV